MIEKSKIHNLLEKIKDLDKDYFKVIVPTILSKTLSTYMLMQEDFLFVKQNAELLVNCKKINPRNEHLEENLWYSLISLYGRCFTNAAHSKKPNLSINDVFKGLAETNIILQTHLKLFEIRNTFIAHRGDNGNEYPIVYLKIPKNKNEYDDDFSFEIVSNRYSTESVEFLNNVSNLIDFVLKNIEIKIQKCGDKLLPKLLELDKELLGTMTLK